MPDVHWTAAQSAAIGWRGGDVLLSAAAGSGKTATLTARIVSLLTDPSSEAEISRMLIVTFTRAAAAELRERIGRALREAMAQARDNARLTRQLCDLGRASITTIDAYCLRALRPHAAAFGLPAAFSVSDESAVRAVERQVMGDVLSDLFTEGEAWFLALADTLSGARNEAALDEVLLALARALTARDLPPEALISADGGGDFLASPLGSGLRARLLRFARHTGALFSAAEEEFAADDKLARAYLPAAAEGARVAEALRAAAERPSYEAARAAVLSFAPPRLGAVKKEMQTGLAAAFRAAWEETKKTLAAWRAVEFAADADLLASAAVRTAETAAGLARVLRRYLGELTARKRERGIVDFSDVETLTARLFVSGDGRPTDAARAAGAEFDYIFIDEYQDTSRTQDAIFTALAAGGGARFMVGDIKQSIYRFRGAEPEVFASYRRRWPPHTDPLPGEADGRSIFMRENFRCDAPVIDFVNLVSRHLFPVTSVPFTADDELVCAKSVPDGYTAAPAEIRLIDRAGDEDEAAWVARRIAEMLGHDRRADGAPLTGGDVAILLRAPGTDGASFADALEARGIPVRRRAAASLYEEPEVLLMLSVLRAVDNPGRDIDLAAAMKSPVFGFSLDDLIRIRRFDRAGSLWDAVRAAAAPPAGDAPAEAADLLSDALRARLAAFVARLGELRRDARGMRADALLLRLYEETDILRCVQEDEARDDDVAAANLEAFYDAARRFENGIGGGLSPFLAAVAEAVEAGEDAGQENTDADAVQILSIHQAKGLEFPVCFLCRADKKRSARDASAAVLFDPAVGAAMRLRDPGGLVRCDTPQRRSLAALLSDAAAEEEMRILYVALTRARERLIITGTVKDPSDALGARRDAAPYFTAQTVFGAPSYLDWMLDAVAAAPDAACVRVLPADAAAPGAEVPDLRAVAGPPRGPDADEIAREREFFAARFAYEYPHAHLARIPAKLTVSRLSPGILDGTEEPVRTALRRDVYAAAMDPAARNRAPRFLRGKTELEASFAGTATHVFLQFCDFERLAQTGAAAERDRLVASGFLSEAMAEAVRLGEIERFRASSLLSRIRAAKTVRREFRFNAALPAARFTTDADLAARLAADDTDVIVQGVVDCLFVEADGRAVLVDYKTDRLTPAELRDPSLAAARLVSRHREQLRWYRVVCAGMLGRPIDETLIYSLPLGDTVAVPEDDA